MSTKLKIIICIIGFAIGYLLFNAKAAAIIIGIIFAAFIIQAVSVFIFRFDLANYLFDKLTKDKYKEIGGNDLGDKEKS